MTVAPASAPHDAAIPDQGHRAVREALLAGAAATVILFVSVYGLWIAVQNTAREQERAEIVRLANTMSSVVDPALHQQLRDSSQTDSPLYLRTVDALRRARNATPGIAYAYTMVRDGESIRFVLDAALPGDHNGDGVEDRSAVWDLYDERDPALNEALGAPGHPGRASATSAPVTDKWGSFISGYAPIYDAGHHQIAVVLQRQGVLPAG